jgi:hypothetical protein
MGLSSKLLFLIFVSVCCFALDNGDPYPKRPASRIPVPALYNQRYSEQTFIGTHDAAAIRTAENGYSISGNQYFNVSTQLNSGVCSTAKAGASYTRLTKHPHRSVFSKPKATQTPMAPPRYGSVISIVLSWMEAVSSNTFPQSRPF